MRNQKRDGRIARVLSMSSEKGQVGDKGVKDIFKGMIMVEQGI